MTKITDFSALTGASVDDANDLVPVVDVSEAGSARNKKMTFAEFSLALGLAAGDAASLSSANAYTDSQIATITGTSSTTALVSGGNVAWESGLTFRISAAVYLINGTEYSSAEQTITLDAADPTDPRFDIIALDTTGPIKITGTPAADPASPDVDPVNEIELTLVQVGAGDTAPEGGVTIEDVYQDNAEWTATTSGTGWDVNSTSGPKSGTKCIEGTLVANKAYVLLDHGAAVDAADYDTLRLYVKSKGAFATGRYIYIRLFNNGAALGVGAQIKDGGSYAFDSSNTTDWQLVAIPMSAFALSAGAQFDQIRIQAQGGTGIGCRIDEVTWQLVSTGVGGGGSGGGSDYTDEMAQDAVGSILTDTGLAVVTYNDATPSIDVNVPAAAASDLNTGTDTTKAVTSDALAGSKFGTATVTLLVSDPNGSAITTGDGKAYWRVPSTLNGMDLIAVAAALTTVSSSGIPTVQIANVTQAADMLTTKLTIDASETDSSTASAAAVIDTSNDDVATGDMLRIDIDVAGTGAKGLMVEMQFRLP